MPLNRDQAILACMGTKPTHTFTPVQLQKLLFLFDKRVAPAVAGTQSVFSFEPYDYGPFDRQVYRDLEDLEQLDAVSIERDADRKMRRYRLTDKGAREAEGYLETIPEPWRGYLGRLAQFVTTASFAQLVSTIYQAYPDMRVNSIFVDPNLK